METLRLHSHLEEEAFLAGVSDIVHLDTLRVAADDTGI